MAEPVSLNKKDVYKIRNLYLYPLALGAISSGGQKAQTGKGALLSCSVGALERLQRACEVGKNDATEIPSPTNF